MKNTDIEKRFREAAENSVPNVFDGVLSECEKRKGSSIMIVTDNRRRLISALTAAAVIMLVIFGGAFGINAYIDNTVGSIISIDVNPSVELKVNSNDKIISSTPLNDDAVKILGDMQLKGVSLDVAVNALIGSMLVNGYISDLANSILISVEDGDTERGRQLTEKLSEQIGAFLSAANLDSSILTQTVNADAETKKLADAYGISVGKALLIKDIMALDSLYTFDSLAGLSVNELNLIAGGAKLESVSATGNASDKAYIGYDAAAKAALLYAGADEASTVITKNKLDSEKGVLVYEVEFVFGGVEYEIDVNALDGGITDYESEHSKSENNTNSTTSSGSAASITPAGENVSYIGEEKAKSIALSDAGLTESAVTKLKVKFDYDDGIAEYEVEFKNGNLEYEYDIRATDGVIIKSEVDDD